MSRAALDETWEEVKKHSAIAWESTKSGFKDMGKGINNLSMQICGFLK